MPNTALDKGNYITVDWTGDIIGFDGTPDDTTPGTISTGSNLVVEKAAGSERKFYVSVSPGANSNGTLGVSLAVTLPGSGGVGPATKSSGITVDYTVPVDHRAANVPAVSVQLPLPHPA